MEIQFTPWRMHYISRTNTPKFAGCVLCGLHQAEATQDPENLVLHRGEHCYVVLNLFPYNTAHLMVVPYAHVDDLPALEGAAAGELMALVQRCVAVVRAEYRPDGFNIGMNVGAVAGAGIAEHLHMHIVPRWGGDSNFMPIIGGVKLIPEDLATTYSRLLPRFAGAG